jgi:hypothetical protein
MRVHLLHPSAVAARACCPNYTSKLLTLLLAFFSHCCCCCCSACSSFVVCCAKLLLLPAVIVWQLFEELRDKLAAKYQELQQKKQVRACVTRHTGLWCLQEKQQRVSQLAAKYQSCCERSRCVSLWCLQEQGLCWCAAFCIFETAGSSESGAAAEEAGVCVCH